MITRDDVFEEFTMSKYATRSDRDIAMADEIVTLRNLINSSFKDPEQILRIETAILLANISRKEVK